MRYLGRMLSLGLVGFALQVGCRDNSPAVPRVAPPEVGRDTYRREVDYAKPLPPQDLPPVAATVPQPYDDEPLHVDISQEAKAFAEIYQKVGRPRIVVFVNRTLDGQILPSRDPGPERVTEHTRKSTTGVTVDRRDYEHTADAYGHRTRAHSDKFQANGPAEYTEVTTEYLKPGEYDDLDAKAIDYGLIETQLADWMSVDGQVAIVSPLMVRKKLSEEQVKDLQSGKPEAMGDLAQTLDADVIIQVQARPTRQAGQGLELRMVAEALNVRGGESLARAAVDMQPPMDKYAINRYTRFLSRKLMDGIIQTWTAPQAADAKGASEPAAKPAPAPQKAVPQKSEPEKKSSNTTQPTKAKKEIVLPPLPPPTLPGQP